MQGILYNVYATNVETGKYFHCFTWRGFHNNHVENMERATKRAYEDAKTFNKKIKDVTVIIADVKEEKDT